MFSEGRLVGKKALVTGSGTGIGRETAIEFARQGADVALHYSHSADGAASAADEIAAIGRRARVFRADFDVLAEVLTLADQAIEFLGEMDCLVNNAGITFTRPFLDITPDQFEKLFNVNVRAQFFLTQRVARHMIEHGGGVVCNIASIHGLQGAPNYSLYSATKGAIVAYTRSIAVELGHRGVRVNSIAPGWVTVENYARAIPDYDPQREKAEAEQIVPIARPGSPLDVAKLAAFLCSDDAGFVAGETVVCDGGSTALISLIKDFRAGPSGNWGTGYV